MKAALTLFTIIPAKCDGEDVKELSNMFHLVVFIGLLYGLMTGGLMYLLSYRFSTLIAAAVALASLHLLNRFLHLDGLSDLGDGMVCGGDAERKLSAMKDSKTGAGGVGYVLIFELLSFAALASITARPEMLYIPLIAEVMNKNAMVFCASSGKAREGLGNAFVANTGAKQAVLSLVSSIILSFGAVALFSAPLGTWYGWDALKYVIVAGAVSAIVGYYMSRVGDRNFHAVNGDVLGATNEICRPVVLMALLLAVSL